MKRIISLLLIFVLVYSIPVMALSIDIKDAGKDIVTVSGSTGSEGLVSVMVINPGFTPANVSAGSDGAVQFYGTVNEGSNGFEIDVRITDPHNYEGGQYTVVYSNGNVTKEDSFIFWLAGTKLEIIETVNSDGVTGLVPELYKIYSLDDTELYKAVSSSSIERVLSAFDDIEEDADKAYSVLLDALHIAAYSEGASLLVKDGKLAYVDVVGIDRETAYNDYITKLSETGMKAVNDAVLGGEYEKDEDITDTFSKAVVLNYITNSSSMGFGHISEVFEKYDELLLEQGINTTLINNVNNKNYVYKKLSASTATTFSGLKQTYLQALEDADSSSGSTPSPGKNNTPYNGPGSAVVSGQQNGSGYLENVEIPFEDMADTQWAQESVAALYRRNIISGKSAKVFDPSGLVTREEFAKMAVLAFVGSVGSMNNPFSDVSGWSTPYVATAFAEGIIMGISDTVFGPLENITREQAATIVARAMESGGYVFDKEPSHFDDDDSVSLWAKNSVASLAGAGVINGREDGLFCPAENMTRAEAAKLIYTAMIKTGGIN